MQQTEYRFENVKLKEGHFNFSAFEGRNELEIVFQVLDITPEKIEQLQEWMKKNQFEYIFNIEQNFEKNILKVDFYKSKGIRGKN